MPDTLNEDWSFEWSGEVWVYNNCHWNSWRSARWKLKDHFVEMQSIQVLMLWRQAVAKIHQLHATFVISW